MNFALELLRSNFGHITCTAGGHERKDLLEDVLQIVVLRNPYDTITSGAERYLDTSNHKGMPKEETINISNIEAVGYQIAGEEERYFEFFKDIESFNNIKILSFELLTENPKKFINKVGSFFNTTPYQNQDLENNIFKKLKESGYGNRIPREKDSSRKIMDQLTIDMYPKETWRCWTMYSNLKAKLDLEGV